MRPQLASWPCRAHLTRDEVEILVNGEPENVDEGRASEILAEEDLEIRVELGLGDETLKIGSLGKEELGQGSVLLLRRNQKKDAPALIEMYSCETKLFLSQTTDLESERHTSLSLYEDLGIGPATESPSCERSQVQYVALSSPRPNSTRISRSSSARISLARAGERSPDQALPFPDYRS
jgi:hypothetical protein